MKDITLNDNKYLIDLETIDALKENIKDKKYLFASLGLFSGVITTEYINVLMADTEMLHFFSTVFAGTGAYTAYKNGVTGAKKTGDIRGSVKNKYSKEKLKQKGLIASSALMLTSGALASIEENPVIYNPLIVTMTMLMMLSADSYGTAKTEKELLKIKRIRTRLK